MIGPLFCVCTSNFFFCFVSVLCFFVFVFGVTLSLLWDGGDNNNNNNGASIAIR